MNAFAASAFAMPRTNPVEAVTGIIMIFPICLAKAAAGVAAAAMDVGRTHDIAIVSQREPARSFWP